MDMYKNNAKGIIVFTNIFHNYWRLESCYRLSHRSTIDTTLLSLEKGCNVFYKFDFVAQFHRTERGVRTKIQTLHRENIKMHLFMQALKSEQCLLVLEIGEKMS